MVRRHRSLWVCVRPAHVRRTARLIGCGGSATPPTSASAGLTIESFSTSVPRAGRSTQPMTPPTLARARPAFAAEVAASRSSFQSTMHGSGNRSRRKPKPGTITVQPYWSGSMSTSVTASTSPAAAPSTATGPVIGRTRSRSSADTSSAVESRPRSASMRVVGLEHDVVARLAGYRWNPADAQRLKQFGSSEQRAAPLVNDHRFCQATSLASAWSCWRKPWPLDQREDGLMSQPVHRRLPPRPCARGGAACRRWLRAGSADVVCWQSMPAGSPC